MKFMSAIGMAAAGLLLFFLTAGILGALVTPTEKQREAEDEEFMEFLKDRKAGGKAREADGNR